MNEYRLVVCEKPSVARSIAAVLGAGKREDGFLSGGGYLVSWCFGHLAELSDADAYDEKYGKWRREDLPILPDSWQYTVARDKQKQMNTLRALMHREDVCEVINACDAGREGELIFRTAYNLNKKGGIIVNEDGLTSREGVYAGGDAVTGAATVILAMGAGKLGAKSIDEYLQKK